MLLTFLNLMLVYAQGKDLCMTKIRIQVSDSFKAKVFVEESSSLVISEEKKLFCLAFSIR